MAGGAEDATGQGAPTQDAAAQGGTGPSPEGPAGASGEAGTHDVDGDIRGDRSGDEAEDDQGARERGSTYHGEGVGRQERVSSGPATGTRGDAHPAPVHHPNSPPGE